MSRLSILFLAMMTLMAFSASAQCPNPAFTIISSTNETCPGASDGTITLDFGDIPDVAAQDYVYFVINLSTGLTPPNEIESGSSVKFNFLTAGNYSISVVEIAFPPCVTTYNNGGTGIVVGSDDFPTIVPLQSKTICSGENVNLEILLNPANFPAATTFDWLAPTMDDGSVQGSPGVSVPTGVAGDIHITDQLFNTTGAPITATYSVTSTIGTCITGPVDVVITIDPAPVIAPNQTKIICGGESVDYEILLAPLNSPSGTTFDWLAPTMSDGSVQGSDGVGVAADPAGILHITDILNNMTNNDITARYTVTPANGCPGAPVDIVITVEPTPALIVGQTKTICSGEAVNLEIILNPANTPNGTFFDWPVPMLSAGPAQGTAGTNVPADPAGVAHITDILVNTTGAAITATYVVTPLHGGCPGTPENIIITIDPEPVILPNQSGIVCSGTSVNHEILLSPANSPAGVTFDWVLPVMSDGSTQGTIGSAVPADPLGTIHINDAFINITGGNITATYTVIATSGICAGQPETIVFTIQPQPAILTGQTKTICHNESVDLEVLLAPLNAPAGTVYDWPLPVMSDGSVQGSVGAGVNADPIGTKHITDILANLTGAPIFATYTITPTSANGCVGVPEDIVITISPEPVIQLGQTKTICSGSQVDWEIIMNPANLPAGTTFDWSAPLMSDGSTQGSAGSGVALGAPGTLHITDILSNSTGAPITAMYAVTPSLGTCVGTTTDIIITVNPEPLIVPSQVKTICSGNPVNLEILLAPLNSPLGTTFDWLVPTMSDGSAQGSAGTAVSADPAGTLHISDVLTNATAGPITATYSIIPSNGSCVGVSENIVITILSDPADVGIVEAPTQTICEGIDQIITLATSELGVDYEVLIDGSSSGLPIVTGDGSANLVIGTITGLVANTYAVTVTATVGSCMITLTDIVNLVINPIPVVSISGSTIVCETTSSTYSVAAGGTTYVWNLTAGGTISSGVGTNVVTVDWITGGGDLSVIVTGPAPTNCSDSDLISVGVFGVLPQMADESLDACQNADQPALTVGSIAGADVSWYIGSVDPANLVGNGPTYVPNSSVLDMSMPGTTIFLVSQTFGCGDSPESTYTVTVETGPNAGISGSTSTCIDAAPVDLIAVLTGTPDTGGIWTDDNNTGALSNGMFDPSIQGNGAFNFTYTVLGAGVCLGIDSSAVVTVTVASGSNLPTADQPSYTSCTFGTPPTIGATGTNIQWYADQALTNLVGSGSSFTPIPGTNIDMTNQGTTSFFATQNEGCGESAGVQIDIILIGVTGEINEIENSYPEQDIGTIDVIDITSSNTPIEIALFDDNGTQVRDWTQVVEISTGVYGFFFDQLATGTYAIVIEDSNGCSKTLAPAVVGVNTDVFIPNVFTPNGDTYNDLFKILNIQSPAKVQINNRWGVNMFSSDDYINDWNAEGAPDGVYYYTVSMGGEVYKGSVEVWRGN